MNKNYRSIWNEALGAWVAVSEIENAKGKPAGSSLESVKPRSTFGTFALRAVLAALLGVPGFYSPSAFADGNLTCTFGGAGTTAPSSAVHSIKCGHGTSASNAYSIAIGPSANAGAEKAVALGEGTVVQGKQSVAVGSQSQAVGEQSVALGNDTRATGKSSVAIGGDDLDAVATSTQTVITGYNTAHANATANNTELARKYFTLTGDYLVNFNEPSKRYIATKSEDGGVAVGVSATSAGLATSFGTRATASGVSSLALGVGSTAEKEGAVAIGAGSTTKDIAGEGITATALNAGKQPLGTNETAAYYRLNLNGVDFDFKAGNSVSAGDIVSFGSPGFERQLKNVAPGKVSENSTDAINGSQLYTVVDALTALKGNVGTLETKQTRFYSIGHGLDTENNYNNDGATGQKSLAAGIGASATHMKTTAVGTNSTATADAALAIGNDVTSSGGAAVAIGSMAKAEGAQAVAIGQRAEARAAWDISIGRNAGVNPVAAVPEGRNIAIGDGTLKHGNNLNNNIAMGTDAGAGLKGDSNVILGTYANSAQAIQSAVNTGTTENQIGVKTVTATQPGGAAQVTIKAVEAANSVAIGTRALASGAAGVAVGQQTKALGATTVAVGNGSRSFGSNAVSMGSNANAGSGGAIAIGQNANNYPDGTPSVTAYRTTGANSIAVGVRSGSSAANAVAIGTEARASVADGVALGSSSKADTALGAVGTDPLAAAADKTGAAWKSTKGAVSLGDVSANVTRQITGLAAGTQDTDAVNVAQLKAAGFNITTAQAGGGVAESTAVDKVLNGETLTFDAGKNIKLTQAENKITVATKDALEVTSVQAGSNVLDGTAMNVGGQAYTNVAAAINALDAKAAPAGAGTHFYSVNNSTATAGNYNNNGATGENALAAGVGVVASGSGSVAVGVNTSSTGLNSVGVGVSARADNQGAVAVGQSANTAAQAGINSVAVGVRTSSQATHAVAIGTDATVSALTVSDGQVADRQGNRYDTALVGAALTGQGSVAIGASSDAQGTNAVAIGQMAEALGQNTLAAGNDSHAIGKSSVAFGDGARTENNSALAAGYVALATGANSTAMGASSKAAATNALASGFRAKAEGINSTAVGNDAYAKNKDTVAVGQSSDALGDSSIAVGKNAQGAGDYAIAVGLDSVAEKDGSVAVGSGAQAKNQYSTAVGNDAKATADKAASFGREANASAENALALGYQSSATAAGGVALGSGSVASVAAGEKGADLLGVVEDKDNAVWTATLGAVSVGNGNTATRQITGLAAGTQDTDAVNVAQLKAAGFKLAAANAGGGESATVADDKIQNGETVTFDAGKNINITHTANQIGIATKDDVAFTTVAAQDAQGNRTEINGSGITVTPNGGGNPVSLTSDGLNNGGKVISNVANGKVESGSQEAVTGDQLYSLQQQLNDSVGNAGKGLNFTGNSGNFNRKLGETVTVKGGLDNNAAASNSNIRTVADSTGNIEILLADAPTFAGKVSARGLDAGNQKITGVLKGDDPTDAVNVGQLKEAIQNVAVTTQNVINANSPFSYVNSKGEMLVRSVENGQVKFTKASDGSAYAEKDISIAALNAEDPQSAIPTAITNVKAGAGDNEAVNVSQLKNTVKALGGGAAVNPDGSVKDPVYSINSAAGGNQTFNNVGDALAALNADTVKPLTFSGDNDTVKVARKLGEELAMKGGAQGNLTSGNIGVEGNADDHTLTVKLAEKVDLGENGSVKTGATTVNNDGVKVEAAGKQPVSLTSDGLNNGGNTIANVGAGKNGTDAVNVSQLTPLAQALGVNADPNSGTVSAPLFTVTKADGSQYGAVNTIQGALDNIGQEIQKPISFAGNSGNTAKKLGESFTVKGALADSAAASSQNLRTKVENGEMLIELAESPRFGNITVNDNGKISGVEAGESEKDAVNKGQLDAVKAAADVKTKVNAGTGVTVENKGSEAAPDYEVALNDATQQSLAKADSALQSIKSADNNLTVGEKQADGSITLDFSDTPAFAEVTAGKTTVGSVVTDGTSGKISGLEKGTVSADSKDAVNGSQLFDLAGNVKSVLGDAFNVDAAGTITAADIGGTGKNTVDEAVKAAFDQANAPLTFSGDNTANDFARKLGTTVGIKGGADEAKLSDNNIGVVSDGQGTLTVKLAKDLNIDSVSAGSTVLDKDGVKAGGNVALTSDGLKAGDVNIGTDGIDAGNKVISKVAAGEKTDDAVNKGQLDAVQSVAAVKTKVHAGAGVAVENKGSDTEPNYEVALNQDTQNRLAKADSALQSITSASPNLTVGEKKADGSIELNFSNTPEFAEVTAGKTTVGSVVTDGASGKISGLSDGLVAAGSQEAVNGSQLFAQGEGVKNIIGGTTVYNPDTGAYTNTDIGGTGQSNINDAIAAVKSTADAGWNLTAQGANGSNVGAGETVDLRNTDGNISVTKAADTDTVVFDLADAISVDSVKAGNTTVNNSGVQVGDKVALTSDGLKAGDLIVGSNGKISGLEAGSDDKDAVNVAQLKAAAAASANKVAAGDNIEVAEEQNADGSTTYTVATAKDVNFDSVTAGSTVLDGNGVKVGNDVALASDGLKAGSLTVGTNGKISGLEAGSIAAGSKEAVNGGQLYAQGAGVKNIIGGTTVYNPDTGAYTNTDIGGTGQSNINDAIAAVKSTADAGWNLTAQGANSSKVSAGETVDLRNADSNITVTKAADTDTVVFDLADAITVNSVKAGDTIVNEGGVQVGDKVALASDGLKAGDLTVGSNGKISGLEAGNDDKDAVNVAQLKTAAAASANKVAAGDNIEVAETKNNDGSTTYTVATAKNVNFDSVTAGDTVLNQDGVKVGNDVALTSGGLKAGDVNITSAGIDAGNKQISGVKAGEQDTDAANVAQLKAAAAASANKVTAGENIEVAETKNDDGSTTYTVATAKEVNFDSVTAGDTVLNQDGVKVGNDVALASDGLKAGSLTVGTNGKISGLEAGSVAADSKEAVNGSQLYGTADSVAKALGGGSAVNADGTVSAPSYTIIDPATGNSSVANNVGDALTKLNSAVNSPLTFAGDSGSNVERKLGTTVNLKGGATGNLTDNNIAVVANGTDTLSIKLAETVNLGSNGSVTTGQTVLNNDGVKVGNDVALTSGGLKAGDVNITSAGIDAGNKQISGVKAGEQDTDAVNVAQLKAAAAASANKVAAGDNIEVAKTKNDDGSTTYTVATAKNVSFDSVTAGTGANRVVLDDAGVSVGGNTYISGNGINANNQKVTNVASGSVAAGSTDAVNGGQLHNTAASVANVFGGNATVNPDGSVSMSNIGGTGANNVNDAIAAVNQAAVEAKTTVSAGDNIVVAQSTNADGSTNYIVSTAKDLAVDSVKAGDTVLNNSGLSIANGPSVTAGGLDAGGKKITNVADGEISATSKDAINGSQLYQAYQVLGGNANAINTITAPATENADGSTTPAGTVVTVVTNPDGTKTTTTETNQTVAVSTDKGGNQYTLTTYNVEGQNTYVTNDVIQAVGKMNEQGIKFFHTNDGVVEPVAQGHNTEDSSASGAYATAIGYQSVASGEGAVAMGNTYNTTDADGNAVAQRTTAEGKNAVAIGTGSQALAENTIAIGTGNVVSGKNSGAIGDPTVVTGDSAYSIGNNNTVSADNAYALGSNIKATLANSVYLGDNASATAVHTTAGGGNYTFAGANDANVAGVEDVVGVVSVGTEGETRQIQNVAAGVVSATSTDAINGSQLHYTNEAINSVANYTVNMGNQLNQRIDDVENRSNAGAATAMAVAGLPQAYMPGKSMVAVAGGVYRGESGYAVGYSSISDNGNWVIKGSATGNSRGHYGATAGVGYQW